MKKSLSVLSCTALLLLASCGQAAPDQSQQRSQVPIENASISQQLPETQAVVQPSDESLAAEVPRLNYINRQNDITWYPDSLPALEERTEFIVQGYLLDDAVEKVEYSAYGNLKHGLTFRTLVVTASFAGDLKAGDTVTFVEDYHTQPNGDVTDVYVNDGYLPSDVGREYILFLYKTGDDTPAEGAYASVCGRDGRYPVVGNGAKQKSLNAYTNDELNILDDPTTSYQEIWQEIIDKYMA